LKRSGLVEVPAMVMTMKKKLFHAPTEASSEKRHLDTIILEVKVMTSLLKIQNFFLLVVV
jgi:hypothetical protein